MKQTMEEKKELIAHMDYGVYIISGENLYDAATATELEESGTWNKEGAHIVVFAPGLVFMLSGNRGTDVPFQTGSPSLSKFRLFDVYEALHMTDKEAFDLTHDLAEDGCDAAIEAMKQGEDMFLPSLAHLTAIHHFSDNINNLIKRFTHDSLIDVHDWYWSCNRYSASFAWSINMNNGFIYSTTKTHSYRVRAISAIDLDSLTLHLFNS